MTAMPPPASASSSPSSSPPPAFRHTIRRLVVQVGVWGLLLVGVPLWRTWDVPSGQAPNFVAPWSPARASPEAAAFAPGATLSLEQWRAMHPGQPVALHFWAQWCPVCKLEEPMVGAVAEHAPVLTLATQSGELPEVVRVLTQRGRDWTVMSDPRGEISRRYGLSVLPAWVVLDAQGRIHSTTTGYSTAWGMRLRLWWAGVSCFDWVNSGCDQGR